MVSIARKNLFQDLPRFIVAQAGIMFAVGLVTIQTGLLNGFTRSSSVLIRSASADLWLASEDLRHLDFTLPIPYKSLRQARAVEGVVQAEALLTQGSIWRDRWGKNGDAKAIAPIRIVGFDPKGSLFQPKPVAAGDWAKLQRPYTLFIDQVDLKTLGVKGVGDSADIGSYQGTIVGLTKGLRAIVSSPFVFTALPTATAYLTSPLMEPKANPPDPPVLRDDNQVTYILIKAKPGTDLEQLKTRLESAVPNTKAFTQAELTTLTQTYWRDSTGVGFILGMGAVVGIIVGTVVVGQILYSSVTDHLREYGTLKAMGSSDWFLYRIILEQALWMAVLGYLPGIGVVLLVGNWTQRVQAIQILVGPLTAGGILALTVVMCCGAAVFAIQKVTRLDPAMVFKS